MIQAGFFECDITPPYHSEVPGGFDKRWARNFCDPLKVRAAAFSDGKEKVILMGIDTLGIGQEFLRQLKDSLPGIHLITSCSHTHFGGMLKDPLPGLEEAPLIIRKAALEEKPAHDPIYYDFCLRQCRMAAEFAIKSLADADFSFGKGRVENLIFNRRIRMKDGRAVTHPGKGNRDAVDYAGPVDDELGVMGVWKKGSGELLGFILNFSCHACINLEGVTADFPGVAVDTVKKVFGGNTRAVYINGASGDVTQIYNLSLIQDRGKEVSYKLGRAVGGEAVKILATAPRGPINTMKYLEENHIVPRKAPVDPEITSAAFREAESGEKGENFNRNYSLILDFLQRKYVPEVKVTLSVFQLGPLVIGSTPFEMFAQFGLDFKKASHFPFTWFSQLSFIQCYIPTADAFHPQTGGGYEVTAAQFLPEAGDGMVRIISRLAEKLSPEAPREEEKVEASNTVWDANFQDRKKK